MCNSGKAFLDSEAFAKVFELGAFELSPVIRDDFLWHSKPTNNVFSDKVNNFLCGNSGQQFRISPFGDVLNNNDGVFGSSFGYWQYTNQIDSLDCEWPQADHLC